MFTTPAVGRQQHPRQAPLRPRGAPRTGAAAGCAGCPRRSASSRRSCLAEEIDTPGEGQIRAFVTMAGNPVLSTPELALGSTPRSPSLEFMVSVDIYVNETTRHADVILPAPSALQKGHYDLALLQLAPAQRRQLQRAGAAARRGPARRVGGAGPPRPRAPGRGGRPPTRPLVDDLMVTSLVQAAVADEHGPIHGRDPEEILGLLAPRTGPGAHPRPDAAHRSLRRRLRRRPRRAHPRQAARATRTASTSARSSPGCPTCCARPTA